MIANTHYGYVGKGGAVPKFTYTGSYNVRDDGVVELLTSGTLVFLNPAVIDRFMVGGGASGFSTGITGDLTTALGGGGGGYTRTDRQITIAANTNIPIVIGAGGQAIKAASPWQNPGGDTKWGNITVSGGIGYDKGQTDIVARRGGAGGSGGGGGVTAKEDYGSGGSDGNNGENGYYSGTVYGGTGQGTTTREFGENTGKLYAGGGGGGKYVYASSSIVSPGGAGGGGAGTCAIFYSNYFTPAGNGEANTGGGGGAGIKPDTNVRNKFSEIGMGGSGGSGIVCFRVAK